MVFPAHRSQTRTRGHFVIAAYHCKAPITYQAGLWRDDRPLVAGLSLAVGFRTAVLTEGCRPPRSGHAVSALLLIL